MSSDREADEMVRGTISSCECRELEASGRAASDREADEMVRGTISSCECREQGERQG